MNILDNINKNKFNIYLALLLLILVILIIYYVYVQIYNIERDILQKENIVDDTNMIKINKCNVIKKTLVLDLDETLVHSILTTSDTYLSIKRPNVNEFLEYVSERFNIIIFTAGMQAYADPILDDLDPNNIIFKKRYYRDSCVYSIKKQGLVKNLNIITNDMKSIIIVDNTSMSYSLQPENGIPIISWYGNDKNDKELLNLIPILDEIYNSDDVRPIIAKYYK